MEMMSAITAVTPVPNNIGSAPNCFRFGAQAVCTRNGRPRLEMEPEAPLTIW